MSCCTDVTLVVDYAPDIEDLIRRICDIGEYDNSPRKCPLLPLDDSGAGGTKGYTADTYAAGWNYLDLDFEDHVRKIAAEESPDSWVLIITNEMTENTRVVVKRPAPPYVVPKFIKDGEVMCPVCTWPNPDNETNCGQCGSNLRGV